MATELKPALILMDLSLPVMDGWEAIRRLKGNPETAAIYHRTHNPRPGWGRKKLVMQESIISAPSRSISIA